MAGKPLIVVLGPTAIGKTGLALKLAQALNGEIIGADSRQVYHYMDIGTAKPTPMQRSSVPHHLVDFIAPDDNLTLARYQALAYAQIDLLHTQGKLPLLVGGTGQYISAVTEGWSIPEVPPNMVFRAELEAYAGAGGGAALHRHLTIVDPEASVKIHPNNVRRVIRALEVYEMTGERISDLQRKKPPPYAILELGLYMERHRLQARADRRVDQMMATGFLMEVRRLLASGFRRDLPSMSGLGYAQLAAYLLDDLPLEQAIADTKTATHQFIRRQLTWFRGHDNGILWHNVEQAHLPDILAMCKKWLNENG